METKEILIIGASNPTIIRTIEDINKNSRQKIYYKILGFLDNNFSKLPKVFFGHNILGSFEMIRNFDKKIGLVNTVASTCETREEVSNYFSNMGFNFENIIHPSVNTNHVKIGVGNIFYESSMVHPLVEIGSNNIISSMAGIAHDTKILNNNFIGPNTYICGRVKIGSNNFFGVSSSIAPRVKIDNNCIIAANSFLKSDLKSYSKVKGIPAKPF